MKVTCVSFFAQRGLPSGAAVRVRARRVWATVSMRTMSPSWTVEDAAMGVVPLRAAAAAEAAAPAATAAGGRRRELAFVVGQLARLAAFTGDHPGGGFLVLRLTPLEIEPLRVAGPAQAGGRIADELGPLHDAVDAQREGPGGARAGLHPWAASAARSSGRSGRAASGWPFLLRGSGAPGRRGLDWPRSA